jgi:hypothetical protein
MSDAVRTHCAPAAAVTVLDNARGGPIDSFNSFENTPNRRT